MGWTVLIPVKALPGAKSRLVTDALPRDDHAELVVAIRADTIAAVESAHEVTRVLLVADAPGAQPGAAAGEFVQTAAGLNGGLLEAARHATRLWPGDRVAAVVADLPALDPAELDAALRAATTAGGFVRDHEGAGTTLLAAPAGAELDPRFGPGSAARHERLVPELPAGPGLRHDVDTQEDLRGAAVLGVGPATAKLIALVMPSSS